MIHEAVAQTELLSLRQMDQNATKYSVYNKLRSSAGMPRYLRYRRSSFFSYGRSIKTQLRCDTHDLAVDAGRRSVPPTPMEQRQCECCQSGEVENAYHFVFDCPLYAQPRLEMADVIYQLVQREDHYGWQRMSWN